MFTSEIFAISLQSLGGRDLLQNCQRWKAGHNVGIAIEVLGFCSHPAKNVFRDHAGYNCNHYQEHMEAFMKTCKKILLSSLAAVILTLPACTTPVKPVSDAAPSQPSATETDQWVFFFCLANRVQSKAGLSV